MGGLNETFVNSQVLNNYWVFLLCAQNNKHMNKNILETFYLLLFRVKATGAQNSQVTCRWAHS